MIQLAPELETKWNVNLKLVRISEDSQKTKCCNTCFCGFTFLYSLFRNRRLFVHFISGKNINIGLYFGFYGCWSSSRIKPSYCAEVVNFAAIGLFRAGCRRRIFITIHCIELHLLQFPWYIGRLKLPLKAKIGAKITPWIFPLFFAFYLQSDGRDNL